MEPLVAILDYFYIKLVDRAHTVNPQSEPNQLNDIRSIRQDSPFSPDEKPQVL